MSDQGIVIIGTGLAGYHSAKALRKLDQDTPITLITKDPGDFYSKPQLSTALLHQKTVNALSLFRAEQMAEQLQATLLVQTSVIRIDRVNKTLVFTSGQLCGYQKLVLACGALVNRVPLLGDGVSSVLSINHLADYARFRDRLIKAQHVVILGTGLVGCELSNDLIQAGFSVTMVTCDDWPLKKYVPQPIGRIIENAFASQGVSWRFNTRVCGVHQNKEGGYTLTLENQKQNLKADLVLSAIGFYPNDKLASQAGLACDQGILVNAQCQTSDPLIYALGDCARINGQWHPYVAPILHASDVVARGLIGKSSAVNFPVMPIVAKTPFCPLLCVPPPTLMPGEWVMDGEGVDKQALFMDDQSQLQGFVLLGRARARRLEFIARLQKKEAP